MTYRYITDEEYKEFQELKKQQRAILDGINIRIYTDYYSKSLDFDVRYHVKFDNNFYDEIKKIVNETLTTFKMELNVADRKAINDAKERISETRTSLREACSMLIKLPWYKRIFNWKETIRDIKMKI